MPCAFASRVCWRRAFAWVRARGARLWETARLARALRRCLSRVVLVQELLMQTGLLGPHSSNPDQILAARDQASNANLILSCQGPNPRTLIKHKTCYFTTMNIETMYILGAGCPPLPAPWQPSCHTPTSILGEMVAPLNYVQLLYAHINQRPSGDHARKVLMGNRQVSLKERRTSGNALGPPQQVPYGIR